MYVEPDPEFQHVTMRRTGGIAGFCERVEVDSSLDATVESARSEHREFRLGPTETARLMAALRRLVSERSKLREQATAPPADRFHYSVDVAWGDQNVHAEAYDPVDDSDPLHDVVACCVQLLQHPQAPFHIM